VLVRRIAEDDSNDLIIAPGIAKTKPLKAEVLAVGPGKWREDENGSYFTPTQVKPGMVVMLSPSVNVGTWADLVDWGGCTMIQEADVLGFLEG
jgi:co-chaperonin GroES (HSP10)